MTEAGHRVQYLTLGRVWLVQTFWSAAGQFHHNNGTGQE
jgi:hypothetical protein